MLDLQLFLQAATVIDQSKSRDLFYPITVAACKSKWRSNNKSKACIEIEILQINP